MQLFDIFEAAGPKRLVVTYPGRFQPFHQGHAEVFHQLQSKFGSDNVYIVSADKVEPPKSPFSFSDKVQFMRAAGIPAHSIINAAKVYDLPEQFPKENTIFIAVVGEPDAKRLGAGGTKKDGSPSYFQPWPGDIKDTETADKHGYVIVEPEHPKTITVNGQQVDVSHGTPVRALWNQIKDKENLRKEFITQMYGKYHAELEPILDKIAESTELNEISLGNYYTKATKDRMQNIAKTMFADPAKPEVIAAKRAIQNRERGIQRMTARNQKTFKAQQQKQRQDLLAQDAANIDQLEAKLAELERQFDKDYEYSDDHRVWSKNNQIRQSIDALRKRINDVRIGLDEGWFGGGQTGKDPWFLKKDGDVMRSPTGIPLKFNSKEEAVQWAMKTFKVSFDKQRIIPTTNPDKNLITTGSVAEEAAGVGVVKNGKDPRYMTATMGDDNKVTADTLPQMMKNYNLIPGKKKTLESKQQLHLHLKRNRFKAIDQKRDQEEQIFKKAMQSVATEVDVDPTDNVDNAVQQYLDRGGKIELLPYKKPRAKDRLDWGSKHIGGRGEVSRGKSNRVGKAAKTSPEGKPVVTAENLGEPGAVESAIIRRIMSQHRDILAQHGPAAVMRAAQEVADMVGDVEEIGSSDVSAWTNRVIQDLEDQMTEGMYEYNRDDPFDSEFAPAAGMGRMTLRSWKQSLARRLKELSDYAQQATQAGNIDQAAMWENIHKKMQNLNLDPIAREIELAHNELEKIRRQGGVRSRAFRQKQFEVQTLEENWKKKLAALGLAGAIGMGAAAPAQADFIDDIMEPVHKVNKVVRDVQNVGRNAGEKIHYYKDKIGRNVEQVPIPGAEKWGRDLRGDVPPPLVDTSPEAEENARRNAEMNREEQRLRQQRQQEQQRQMQQVPERPWYDKY